MTGGPTPARAIVLAAGRGERMRPLTDTTPKPLLPVQGRPMIEWHLLALARAGVQEVVINTAWLEEQFPATLGDGSRFGLRLHYSHEGRDHGGALETAGGIAKALPWLAPTRDEVFWVVSGDIYCPDFEFKPSLVDAFRASDDDAQLWVVANPDFNRRGDFDMSPDGRLRRDTAARPWTYANLALMRPRMVGAVRTGERAALGPLLFESAERKQLSGLLLQGPWENVGTPAQLARLSALPHTSSASR